jgi:AraC-like DNA-binding protein
MSKQFKPEDLQKAEEIKAFIDEKYHLHYTNDELARLVGSNKSTLNLAFRHLTGNAMYEYLIKVRIEQAKLLLVNTNNTIEVVAKNVGLDRSNLIKQFKKITGMTPLKWRHSYH